VGQPGGLLGLARVNGPPRAPGEAAGAGACTDLPGAVDLQATGRDPRSAPAPEFYRNSPGTTPAEELQTEIWVPVTP